MLNVENKTCAWFSWFHICKSANTRAQYQNKHTRDEKCMRDAEIVKGKPNNNSHKLINCDPATAFKYRSMSTF